MSGLARISTVLTGALLVASATFAQEGAGGPGRDRQGPRGPRMRRMQELRQELIQQFDANADGQLDEGEREAAMAAARQRIAQHLQENGVEAPSAEQLDRMAHMLLLGRQGPPPWAANDGEGNAEGPRAQMRECLDTDGDGVISEEERQAARDRARQKLLERFDADGDGVLAGEELDEIARILLRVRLRNQFGQGQGRPGDEGGEAEGHARRGRGQMRGRGQNGNFGGGGRGHRPPADEPAPY
jgi:Ca2+-binding EF-hand superfamily protein